MKSPFGLNTFGITIVASSAIVIHSLAVSAHPLVLDATKTIQKTPSLEKTCVSLDNEEVFVPEAGSPKFQDEIPPLVEISVNDTVEFTGNTPDGETVKFATGFGSTVIMFVMVAVSVQLFRSVQTMLTV